MASDASVRFFDAQFQRQVREGGLRLNPLDASPAAIQHLSQAAQAAALALRWCLFAAGELQRHFAGREILPGAKEDFPAPAGRVKRFATVVARKLASPPSGETAVM
ncbi:hypothetical protein JJB11_03040 [Ramlibacter ginsenosidimutans]|uniref:Uncharacterized protein n=1 Tax=Ramlibacter ginsenosidimutans TaxID=502333 RepID=A0A934WLF7_9BURK|nr:hypothetical protein [Ramlibacter ginsenosidimutans]MBK6005057.1 hypothetical protein [Ramlibacter ginsenosidimutans]